MLRVVLVLFKIIGENKKKKTTPVFDEIDLGYFVVLIQK